MNSVLVLVAALASLVHAAPSHYPYAYPVHAPAPAWHGPLASPVVLPSGYLADTPEVSALKHAHAAALAAAPAGHSYAPHHGYAAAAPAHVPAHTPAWHGPLAAPVVLHTGYLADTPEVVALRAAHAAAHGHGHGHGYYH